MESQTPHPYAGSWEGPWEGRNPGWMYALQGRAWLEIAADGQVAAELSIEPGGASSRWQGRIFVSGEIELDELRTGSEAGNAHGEGELLPSGRLQIKLIIGGLQPVPFEAELELTRRREERGDPVGGRRDKPGFLQAWRERLKLRRMVRCQPSG
jgi:hypothetical protein